MEGASTAGALAASMLLGRAIRRSRLAPLPAEILGAGLSLMPALASLRGTQVAGYHGAEHKAIGGYEQGAASEQASKEHERCGSHMVGPMLAATVVGNVVVNRLPASRRGPARLLAGLAAVGVATEVFAWMTPPLRARRFRGRCGGPATSCSGWPPPANRPTEELEVAEAALDEVLRLEGATRRAA